MDTSIRVDVLLVRRGLARSRAHAASLVREGRVHLGEVLVAKPALAVTVDAELSVEMTAEPGYASRAAIKLAGVLDALGIDGPTVDGANCLDIGASTGGFTDVLLRRGARHVLAVDVGHDQLLPALRADPRVSVREGLNARELDRSSIPVAPDLVVADLSFISLRMVLPAVGGVIHATTDLLVMVKPQFEVGRERLGRGGVVRSAELRAKAVVDVARAAGDLGLQVRAVIASPLPGPSGNREYFVWLRPEGGIVDVRAAVLRAVNWDPDSGPVPPVCWVGDGEGGGPERLVPSTTTQGDP